MNHWKVQKYDNPWPYIIIDNFFDDEVWGYIQNKIIANKKEYIEQNRKYVDTHIGGYLFEAIPDQTLKNFFDKNLTIDFIKNNFKRHMGFTEIYSEVDIKFHYKPKAHRIHDEVPQKVLSTVVYVDPTHNVGTVIFDKDKNFHGVITWKPNRALVFTAESGVTWHSFGNWENSMRITIDHFIQRIDSDFSLPDWLNYDV